MATKAMKKIFSLVLCVLFLTGCFWGDEPTSSKELTKDFWLKWWGDIRDQHVLLSFSKNGNSGTPIIKETVFAIGHNDHFIIAKQHPNLEEEVQKRLFNVDTTEDAFILSDPKDTIWLAREDSIYLKKNNWYHTSNGWNPPDSLKPYKRITLFHIIDIRDYNSKNHEGYKTYSFDNEENFNLKRIELGVPSDLMMKVTDPSLE